MGIYGKINARAGQILLPSLFVIPSLLLFVYLLFETTKVSREKMRQQFAVDSAAFIQMGDYTNLFNRTAYVNGAFPYRIFKEAYECPGPDGANIPIENANGSGKKCAYDILYESGAFPKYKNDVKGQPVTALDDKKKWEIEYYEPARPDINENPAVIAQSQAIRSHPKSKYHYPTATLQIISLEECLKSRLSKTEAEAMWQFYAQVYKLLGDVQKSQWTVFDRFTENFNFFRKSYYLNANTQACVDNPQSCGNDGIFSPGGFSMNKLALGSSFQMHYIQKMAYNAKYDNPADPYDFGNSVASFPENNPGIDMTALFPSDGLFQLATIDGSKLGQFGRGIEAFQGWDAPSNFFNVDLNTLGKCRETGRPCVHSRVTSQCPQLNTENNNCVWPNPTPKYQTRLYP